MTIRTRFTHVAGDEIASDGDQIGLRLHQALGNSLQGLWFQENPRVNVRYEQNAQRREVLGPCRWGEL